MGGLERFHCTGNAHVWSRILMVNPLKCCLLHPRNAPYCSLPLLPADADSVCVHAEYIWSLLCLFCEYIRGRNLLQVSIIALCSVFEER